MDLTQTLRPASLAVALAALLIGGCTEKQLNQPVEDTVEDAARHMFDHAKWRQLPPIYRAIAEPITISHRVTFKPDSAELDAETRYAIHAFLREAGVASGERIEVDGPRNRGGVHAPLTAARLAAIQAELGRTGLDASVPVRRQQSFPNGEDEAEILITRTMVIPPDCDPGPPGRGERPEYRWTCADASNLGHMVANPTDLEYGRTISPADGEATTLGIQRYRRGEIIPIINEVTN